LAVNFLLIESLQRFHQYYGEDLQVECPTGSGEYMNLAQVAEEIQHRIIHIFGRDEDGQRSFNGGNRKMNNDPHFRDYIQFYEVRAGPRKRGNQLTIRSISMAMTVVDWVHHTRLGGGSHLMSSSNPFLTFDLRTGLVAFHIMQSGLSCRLPRTPRSTSKPRSRVPLLTQLVTSPSQPGEALLRCECS
jgi:hypothetical protein